MTSNNSNTNLKQWIKSAKLALEESKVSNAQQEINWLLQSIGIATGFHTANQAQLQILDQLLLRRLKGEPLAYILGSWSFMALELQVNHHVLIPRPETESMVETILEQSPNNSRLLVLDLGTGSGAIACALASMRRNWCITACDSSINALNVARLNVEILKLDQQIRLIQSHWFSHVTDSFDLIVANPPYLSEHEYQNNTALQWEPKTALVAKKEGLSDYESIISQSHDYLKPGGVCYLEHGHLQSEAIISIIKSYAFTNIKQGFDLSGKPRYLYYQKSKNMSI